MKDVYKQFNNIEVDLEKINSINIELDDVTKKRIKNNLHLSIKSKKRRILLKIGIPTAVALLLGISFFAVPRESLIAFAYNIPVLKTFFTDYKEHYGGDFEEYTHVIGKSVKDKGFEVTIDEVVVDNASFKLIYTIKSDEKISKIKKIPSPFPFAAGKTIKLNGKAINASSGGSEKDIDEYTVQVIESLDADLSKIPNNFTAEIGINKLANVSGNWNFKFDASKEKTTKETKKYKLDAEFRTEFIDSGNEKKYGEIIFKEITFSPISTIITFETNNQNFALTDVIFKDDKGNIIGDNGASLKDDKYGKYELNPVKEVPNKIIVERKDSVTLKVTTLEIPIK